MFYKICWKWVNVNLIGWDDVIRIFAQDFQKLIAWCDIIKMLKYSSANYLTMNAIITNEALGKRPWQNKIAEWLPSLDSVTKNSGDKINA